MFKKSRQKNKSKNHNDINPAKNEDNVYVLVFYYALMLCLPISLHLWIGIHKLNRVCGSVEKVKTTSIIPFVGFLFQEFMGQSLF